MNKKLSLAKPDKRIFEIALERANCKPENAVMIDDRVDNDIVPAKKMGMKTVWIKQGFGQYWQVCGDDEQADYIVEDLNELIIIFMRLREMLLLIIVYHVEISRY